MSQENDAQTSFVILCGMQSFLKGKKNVAMYKIHGECSVSLMINMIQSKYPNANIMCAVGYDADKVSKYIINTFPHVSIVNLVNADNASVLNQVRFAANALPPQNVYFVPLNYIYNIQLHHDNKNYLDCIKKERLYTKKYIGVVHNGQNRIVSVEYNVGEYAWCGGIYVCRDDFIEFKKLINKKARSIYSIHKMLDNFCSLNKIPFHVNNVKKIIGSIKNG